MFDWLRLFRAGSRAGFLPRAREWGEVMPALYHYGLPVLLVLLVLPCDLVLMKFFAILQPAEKIPRLRAAGFMAVTAVVFYAMGVWGIPLPVFYLTLFISKCLFFLLLGGRMVCRWFVADIGILIFASVHLLVLGVTALFLKTSIFALLSSFSMRNLCLIIATFADLCIGLGIVLNGELKEKSRLMGQSGEEFRLLIRFSWFGIGYVLFDSIPSMYNLPGSFAALFLIGSVLLLLMMVYVFMSHVYSITKNAWLEEEHDRLERQKLEHLQRARRLRIAAYLDGLTGAYTRLFAMEQMNLLLASGEPLALVYIDLDHLKKVNDEYGHTIGDRYLLDFSALIRENLDRDDIFARFGGDEFLILFPNCGKGQADTRMEEIRSKAPAVTHGAVPLSFSFGVVEVPAHSPKTAEQLISEADHNMYADKLSRQSGGHS